MSVSVIILKICISVLCKSDSIFVLFTAIPYLIEFLMKKVIFISNNNNSLQIYVLL